MAGDPGRDSKEPESESLGFCDGQFVVEGEVS